MIKELFDNLILEIGNEKNQERLSYVVEPLYNKMKYSYYIIVLLLLLVIANLLYISFKIYVFSNVPSVTLPTVPPVPIIPVPVVSG